MALLDTKRIDVNRPSGGEVEKEIPLFCLLLLTRSRRSCDREDRAGDDDDGDDDDDYDDDEGEIDPVAAESRSY